MQRLSPYWGWLGLALVAGVAVPPLVWGQRPVGFVAAHGSPAADWGSKVAVVLVMGMAVAVRAAADRGSEPRPVLLTLGLAALALALTAWHWYKVDVLYLSNEHVWGQPGHYLDVLNRVGDGPHPFRPLPYGFIRTLELLTGDWIFARQAYRAFFLYWFVWAYHRFARLFLSPGRSLAALLVLPVLYPQSVQYYAGQPTDPLSHALFALALIYVVQDRWVALAAALGLGVAAKETAVVIVVGYAACYGWQGLPALAKTVLLGTVCTAAFLATRLPLDWRPSQRAINGVSELMIRSNLGLPGAAYQGVAPLYESYLQPLLFIGLFVPFIVWHWRRQDGRLKALVLTVPPLVLLSSLCFSWVFESRNYVPLLPLLTTMVLAGARSPKAQPFGSSP